MREQRQYERSKATVNERERERQQKREAREREISSCWAATTSTHAQTNKRSFRDTRARTLPIEGARENKRAVLFLLEKESSDIFSVFFFRIVVLHFSFYGKTNQNQTFRVLTSSLSPTDRAGKQGEGNARALVYCFFHRLSFFSVVVRFLSLFLSLSLSLSKQSQRPSLRQTWPR